VSVELWDQRVDAPPANDLISMLAHGPSTKDMPLMELLGNIILLIVGGADTTRNSITGGLIAFTKYPDQLARLRADPASACAWPRCSSRSSGRRSCAASRPSRSSRSRCA